MEKLRELIILRNNEQDSPSSVKTGLSKSVVSSISFIGPAVITFLA